jgi:hypothetical protein
LSRELRVTISELDLCGAGALARETPTANPKPRSQEKSFFFGTANNDKMNEIRGALAPIHNTENVGKIHAPGDRLSEAVDGPDQLRTHLMADFTGNSPVIHSDPSRQSEAGTDTPRSYYEVRSKSAVVLDPS